MLHLDHIFCSYCCYTMLTQLQFYELIIFLIMHLDHESNERAGDFELSQFAPL